MGKGKSVHATYKCPDCKTMSKTVAHLPRNPVPDRRKFCRKCRKHTLQSAKDVKKGGTKKMLDQK